AGFGILKGLGRLFAEQTALGVAGVVVLLLAAGGALVYRRRRAVRMGETPDAVVIDEAAVPSSGDASGDAASDKS
ncbi:hypothetical protein CG717_07105, partial [Streptomyces sp. CB02613]